MNKLTPLTQQPPNTPLRIIKISGDSHIRNRLFALGFVEGTIIEITNSYWYKDLIVNIRGTYIGLSKDVAKDILTAVC